MARYESSLSQQKAATAPISRRAFNLLTYGIVTLCFTVTWGMYNFVQSGSIYSITQINPLILIAVYLVGSIGGLVLMNIGKSKESVGFSATGLTLFTLTFGGTLSLLLTRYSVGTITNAFAITACLSGIFLIAGVLFPDFFASIGRMLGLALLALIVIEIFSTMFLHVDQTLFDYIAILLFCGFLGYDSYLMAADTPTVPNAIFYAANIYLDIVNILVRVLNIMDRD
ncbi:MAG: US12 family protein [Atopobiaceae bacterium]|nr:US12 family protein [Atopobiaceae bacterium]